MKKRLLSVMVLATGLSYGQIVFSENFNAAAALPSGWVQYNVDGNTPASSMNFMGNNAWIVDDVAGEEGHGNYATSTSYYTPAGTSDDWMVTPMISIPTGASSYIIKYDVQAYHPSYPDNYEVWITKTGNTVDDFLDNGAKIKAEVGPAGSWESKSITIPVAYEDEDVYIAFRNVANDEYLLFVDNIVVMGVIPNNISLDAVTHNRFGLKGVDNAITYRVTNQGDNAVTSLRIKYDDGSSVVEEGVVVNIAPFQTKNVNIPTPLNYSTIVEKTISHEIIQVNGVNDADPTDNTIDDTKFNTISQHFNRNVVFEEGTGTWCQWCVRGFIAMDYMEETYDDFIGIAVHNQDPMAVTAYDNGLGISAFPGGKVDRVIDTDVDKGVFVQQYNKRKAVEAPVKVEAIVTSSGTNITIDAKATFNTSISSSNFRLAAVMAEHNVTGTTSGYAQKNAYAGGSYGAMGGYENKPATVPASEMVYNHVGRALLGGFNGQANTVPTTITDGMEAEYTFNYTIPSASHKNNMYAVVMVIDNETGEILNAAKYDIASVSTNEVDNAINFEVYPNPANETIHVALDNQVADYTVSVYDLSGQLMVEKTVTNNVNSVSTTSLDVSSLASGSYIVTFATDKQSYSKHFVKD